MCLPVPKGPCESLDDQSVRVISVSTLYFVCALGHPLPDYKVRVNIVHVSVLTIYFICTLSYPLPDYKVRVNV